MDESGADALLHANTPQIDTYCQYETAIDYRELASDYCLSVTVSHINNIEYLC